ncbi:alpha/beta hydrolase fold domain-containing protein [Maribacter sp. CXY002]|uniref:alpha/beta hydrolase fold domain-containing protein n=1 Tax=Maribacter luteocoastalis TaxID=3407671 RepID=UPI003B67A0B0
MLNTSSCIQMGKTTILILNILFCMTVYTQSYVGVTGIRDSSYNNKAAFANDVKKYPNIKLVTNFEFSTVESTKDIVYANLTSRPLLLDVFKPIKNVSDTRTAIIIIHGGGWRTGNRTQHYPLAASLANLGYVCFTPEYRLSTEALFPSAVYDLKKTVKWVRSNAKAYNINPDKIVVLGFSAGGELAAFLGTTGDMSLFEGTETPSTVSSKVNAVVDIDGTLAFIHPESGEGDDSKGTSAATYWFGYSKKENPVLWKAAAPLTYVGPNTPPTLFINSSVDRMHAGRDDYMAVLRKNSIYSEVIHFETAPHSFILYHPWFNPSVEGIDRFLRIIFEQ